MVSSQVVDGKRYSIGVIGDLPALMAFWETFRDQANDAVLGEIGIVAAAFPGQGALPGLYQPVGSIRTYTNYQEMLEKHPEINLVIEATGRPSFVAELRATLPSHITLVEQTAANFFIKLLTQDKMWVACKLDLLHTQSMLKTIIDQMDEEILFLDLDGRVLDSNQKARDRADMPSRKIIGRDLHAIFTGMHAMGNEEHDCPFQQTLHTDERGEALASYVGEDGRVQYYRIYTYPIHDEAGNLCNVVAMRRNITRRMEMEQRLQQSEKLASIGELSTYIAHEIRNPLFTISGFANSLVRNKSVDDKVREKLNIILEESRRLDIILKSIINFTRPTEAEITMVDINELVTSTMEVMGLGLSQQHIELVRELEAGMAMVKANPEVIKQCLINLVKNAIEAMPEGGVLTIATGMNRDYATLTVEDTGVGIEPEVREKIFSPFFSTKGKGSGLGLAMTRKIMDEIGGEVDLTSSVGKGTRITLLLPPILAVAESPAPE
ncbi:two-component system sensor histidine kinase NtrB [Salidesulfovibrio onnuriiensis]|uniref:two-component system sensor histidine kinase NtrB n=1 Tax=Salidesulfovibrio onnuriiensis TaxID=2583823 RepID=UPI0011CB676B|nr:ATP-binding protein [Salidesulfovibrio onnuriiensis]